MVESVRVVAKTGKVTVHLMRFALAIALIAGLSCAAGRAWAQDQGQGQDQAPLAIGDVVTQADEQGTLVELYSVAATGGINNTIGVGDVVSADVKKIKTVSGSTSTYAAALEEGDEVSYQWQYANTSSTSDSAFTDIEGATGPSFTVTADFVGKYLRVKATSQNTVVSTQKPYYGTTTSVAPIGPVQAQAGAVTLSRVDIVSNRANIMWVGAVVSPTAMYIPDGSYLEQAVPADAQLTYTWKVADAQTGPYEAFDPALYPQSSVSATGELTVGADLQGKYVRVEANALLNTVSSFNWPVLPEGVYDLMRITFGNNELYAGDTIYTTLQAKTLAYENEASYGITVPFDNEFVTYQWYSTSDTPVEVGDELDFSGATWTPVPDGTEADLVIPESIAGSYVKVVATSASGDVSSTVERVSTKRVLSRTSLSTVVTRLEEIMYHPYPVYGVKTNMNELVEARVEALGFGGVKAKVKSWYASLEDEKAHLGISTADDDTNGDVTFFSYDNAADQSTHSFVTQRQVHVTFELSRGDEEPVEYGVVTNIPWDLETAAAILDEQTAGLAIGFAEGDSAETVTQDMTLPCKVGVIWVSWESSNADVLQVAGDYSWEDYTGVVLRGADDTDVVLTATLDASIIDTSDESLEALTTTRDFPVTVKGNAQMIDEANAALAAALDASWVHSNVKAQTTGKGIDPVAVAGDLGLPTTRTLFYGSGLNSGDYRVTYASSDEGIAKVNGYRVYVYRPLPEQGDATVSITLTAVHRTLPGVSYQKALEFTVKALDEGEIDEDIAFMQQVKNNIFTGYSEGKQDQDAVTSNLHSFLRAYFDEEGALHWQYAASDSAASAYEVGFTPQTVAEHTSGDASYSNFVSSHPGIVTDSNLLVYRPKRDTGVSVTCCLSSDRFGAYYERYANDEACSDDLKQKFKQLYRQIVPCQFTVKGTQVSDAVREALLGAADELEELASAAVVSVDGSDVLEDAVWVDEATMQALVDAIARARAIAAKDGVTEAEIASANEELEAARSAFGQACQPGTLPFASDEDQAALATAADDAEQALASVYTSEDGTDVDVSRKWAPADVVDRLLAAIDAARSLASGHVPAADVQAARSELRDAFAVFTVSTSYGSKKAASPDDPSSSENVKAGQLVDAGSGASKASYQVATVATSSALGSVWYAKAKVSKSAKSAVVPAAVTIGGQKYRVIGVKTGAFKNLKSLAKVTIGANVAKVRKSAFKNTPKLKRLVVKSKKLKKASSVKAALKGSKARKLTVKLPKTIRKAAKKAFTKKNLKAPRAVTVK